MFLPYARETFAEHHERAPADPRTSHHVALEVDDAGNVLLSASLAYGRRVDDPDPDLTDDDRAAQRALLATVTRTLVTNPVDTPGAHRPPQPFDTRTYELTGLALPSGCHRLTPDELRAAIAAAVEIPFDQVPGGGVVERRLIEAVHTRYRRDDLTGPLPVGGLEPLALPYETYTMTLPAGLVAGVFGADAPDALLADAGYVHLDGDPHWWAGSGRIAYAADPADDELAQARAHFFTGRRYTDPFGNATTVGYDRYDLVVVENADALGNTTRATVDYRVLGPVQVTDPNGNRSSAVYDALGLVVTTAVSGKPGEGLGDRLDGLETDPPPRAVDAFFADPDATAAGLLADATSRIVYDVDRYRRSGGAEPVHVATIVRETHVSDLDGVPSRLRTTFAYGDGTGRDLQQKVPAEPDANGAARWAGTGWTVLDNKGNPVRVYEPFFSATHRFEFAAEVGVSPILLYDPLGRAVATVRPDHAFTKIAVSAWRQATWDVNDTVLDADPAADPDVGGLVARLPPPAYLPTWHAARIGGGLGPDEQVAAQRAQAHAGTPTTAHFDSLGRAFLNVARRRDGRPIRTRFHLTIDGRARAVVDTLGRTVVRVDFDMLGRQVRRAGMDACPRARRCSSRRRPAVPATTRTPHRIPPRSCPVAPP